MLRFLTLGAVRLVDSSGASIDIAGTQPKRLALLAYLAVARPRGGQRRDRIVAMLWPELDQNRARSALRQALYVLRRTFGDDLILTGGMNDIAVNRERLTCDAWDLDAAIDRRDANEVARLLQGELLTGLFVSDAPEFEQWLDDERMRVRATAAKAFFDAARGAPDVRECADWLARAVRLTPLDESGARHGMMLLAERGDRSGALAMFDALTQRLDRELEVPPSPETSALAAKIRTMPLTDAVVSLARERMPRSPAAPHAAPARSPHTRAPWLVAAAAVLLLAANTRIGRGGDERDARIVAVVGDNGAPVRASLASSRLMTVLAADADVERAGTLVRVTATTVADSSRNSAEVIDATRNAIIRVVEGAWTHRPQDANVQAAFGEQVATAVATALYPGWANGLSDPPSLSAYRAFVEGMAEIKRERHESAAALFAAAFREDSAFTAAGLLAAAELHQLGLTATADTIVRAVARRRAQLPAVDLALLDWMDARLRGDQLAAFAFISRVAELAPDAELAQLEVAIEANETARPEMALAALNRFASSAEFGEAWPGYWSSRAETLHLMGEHERELADIRRALVRHPETRLLEGYELRALAALGRTAEVRAKIDLLVGGDRSPAAAAVVRQTASELRAHGHPQLAAQLLADVRRWIQTGHVAAPDSMTRQIGLARTAYLQDDRATARRVYSSILGAGRSCVDCVGLLGVLAARDGDTTGVARADQQLAATSVPYQFGRHTLWRARIAATSGDTRRAATLLRSAFAQGLELDINHHTDVALAGIDPSAVYRTLLGR